MTEAALEALTSARRLFDTEIQALESVRDSLDQRFLDILEQIVNCRGKVIITGMGKPGHIGTKIAATMASLGTPAFYLHPAEALHGDLGMVGADDVVLAISYSGESDEVIRLIPSLKLIGATLIGISGNADSTLIRFSDYSFVFPPFEEACHMHLAPTSARQPHWCWETRWRSVPQSSMGSMRRILPCSTPQVLWESGFLCAPAT